MVVMAASNLVNLEKIESFYNDPAYKEILESSETYNTRLCIERRLRMPFLDSQTGTAQNNCALLKIRRQRIPGLREGQLYSYPAARWRKSRRQYLLQRSYYQHHRPVFREETMAMDGGDFSNHSMGPDNIPTSLAGVVDMDSGGMVGKDEMMSNKEWYYDEMDMNDMDTGYDDPDPDSDFDYEEPYHIRKGKGGGGGGKKGRSEGSTRKSKAAASERTGSDTPTKKSSGSRRGRKSKLNLDGDRSSSPMAYSSKKSRHSMQIHDDHSNSSFVANLDSPHTPHMPTSHQSSSQNQMITPRPELFGGSITEQAPLTPIATTNTASASSSAAGPFSDPSGGPPAPSAIAASEKDHSRRGEKGKLAAPSPYCDFCLGDTRENKKTGTAEELVSCSDCGRSGHPSCLQFTANMMVSVKRYRWQCIECKYCSICGTSDNDDQLLFCDDCDRGYHMYCLSPALTSPPEGSWSCKLCLAEFHTPKRDPGPAAAASAPSSGPSSVATASPPASAISQQLQQPPVSSAPSGPLPPSSVAGPILSGPPMPPTSQPMPYGPPPPQQQQMMGPHPGGPPPGPPMMHHPGPVGPPHPSGPMPPQGVYMGPGPPALGPHGPPPTGPPPPTTHANQ